MATLSLFALWYSVLLLKRQDLPGLDTLSVQELFVLALAFYPLLRSILSGQNTALSLLCFVSTCYWLSQRREIMSGLFLSAWLFKPHFALLLLSWGICAGRMRLLIGFLPGAFLLYLLGALAFGFDWPLWWIQSINQSFLPSEFAFNGKNQLSLLGVLQQLFGYRSFEALSIAIIGSLFLWWMGAKLVRSNNNCLPIIGAELSILLTLIAPHVMWYDLGLVLPALFFIYSRNVSLALVIICMSWVISALPGADISPYFWLLIGVQVAVLFCCIFRSDQR